MEVECFGEKNASGQKVIAPEMGQGKSLLTSDIQRKNYSHYQSSQWKKLLWE